ncbi:VWA domain-containing protein [Corynebacterium cystitidis]|uniref:VWA domain-containing protein n=1 Tax=Corynebacterium cystitidis TaxID=35757 RepID=UPI00211DC7AB|nr:VWA domain-containing protein [Corynebacterium cystitidis]
MGRHSSGENNYKLSRGLSATLIALVLIIALIAWFFFLREDSGEDQAQPNCISGDLTLPIATTNEEITQPLIEAYAASQPIVRDYCVTPKLVGTFSAAAVVVAADSPVTNGALDEASRTPSTSERLAVASDPAGVSGESRTPNAAEVRADDVDYSTATDAAIAARVASVLAETPEQARAALGATGGSYQVGSESAGEKNFVALDGAEVIYTAIPLNPDGEVTEDQTRAGSDFAQFAAASYEGAEAAESIDPSVWAAAAQVVSQAQISSHAKDSAPSPTPTAAPSTSESQAHIMDTLFLLDTSQAMDPYANAAARAIGDAANKVIDQHHEVALWNYSSPLNPGVTKSWRSNVQFTDEKDAVANKVSVLANAGDSNTREAMRAAVEALAGFNGEYHIVLVTSGTSDADDDAAFLSTLEPLLANGVTLSVVHVGDGQKDAAVTGIAKTSEHASTADELGNAINKAAGF